MMTLLLLIFGVSATSYGTAVMVGRSTRLKFDRAIVAAMRRPQLLPPQRDTPSASGEWKPTPPFPQLRPAMSSLHGADERPSLMHRMRGLGFAVYETARLVSVRKQLVESVVFAISGSRCPDCGYVARTLYLPDRGSWGEIDAGVCFQAGSFCDRSECAWYDGDVDDDCGNFLAIMLRLEGTLACALDFIEARMGDLRKLIDDYRRLEDGVHALDDESAKLTGIDAYGRLASEDDRGANFLRWLNGCERTMLAETMRGLRKEIDARVRSIELPAFLLTI